jgi:hypothetical protein
MPKPLTSPTARKWQAYNRWRANSREIDRKRRLERIAQREAEALAAPAPPIPKCKVPRVKAHASVRVRFADGTTAGFRVYMTPWGTLNPCATKAGRALAQILIHGHK